MPTSDRWDLFCKVVDNYGDAGVCWRLARQLAKEHALDVTLWLDDLATLSTIAPGVDRTRDRQQAASVTIRRWTDPYPAAVPADVVVEAFGCGLPESYVAAMTRKAAAPAWFIFEYLSAESWIEASHGLVSPHPRLPLSRRFWFPGFTSQTGGLLRERDLIHARDSFRRDAVAKSALWSSLGVPPVAADEIRISLFCYSNPALPALFDAWADGDAQVTCVVPQGVAASALDRWTSGNVPHPGTPFVRGRLSLHATHFLAQDDYDRLLWECAVNFVRGEDSFVRAQWASRAFAWHVYPQAGNAHWRKHDAFLDRYVAGLAKGPEAALRRFWRAWNGASEAGPIGDAWRDYEAVLADLQRHTEAWAAKLASLPDLAGGLVSAAAERV
jgi:uncharacterized repeat protein (TIGR03837 family)